MVPEIGRRARAMVLAVALLFVSFQAAFSAELAIVTSFPPSFYEPFRAGFEARHPDVRLTIIQRNTGSASRYILEKSDAAADIFWASATDAFELLKRQGALHPISPRPTGAPSTVFGYPVDDPDGFYLGFALSGYGLVYNPAYLAQHNLPKPENWQDLLEPAYSGHIGITSPSRSGTTHLIVEALLQSFGWDRGWALLSEIGGNLSTVTARSFGVASGVAKRRFGLGITIDFLANAPDVSDGQNVFVLTPAPLYVPANIAILSRARDVGAANLFVDFVLSEEGQSILLRPAIGRIPVRAALSAGLLPEAGTGGLLAGKGFDARLSAERYGIVNLIFDDYIVRRRAMLSRLWTRLRDLEAEPASDPARREVLEDVRRLLGAAPLSAAEVGSLADDLKGEWPRGISRTAAQKTFARDIRGVIEQNLASAEARLLTISTRTSGQ